MSEIETCVISMETFRELSEAKELLGQMNVETTGIIERVGRQIFGVVTFAQPNAFHPQYENESALWEAAACAAINAMREPTEQMVTVGVEQATKVSLGGGYHWRDYIADKHRAMISAALTPEGAGTIGKSPLSVRGT